jgi:hypothetical protein
MCLFSVIVDKPRRPIAMQSEWRLLKDMSTKRLGSLDTILEVGCLTYVEPQPESTQAGLILESVPSPSKLHFPEIVATAPLSIDRI